jgi:hypothetical protein
MSQEIPGIGGRDHHSPPPVASKQFGQQNRGFFSQKPHANQLFDRRRSWWSASTIADIEPSDLRCQAAHLHALGPRSLHEHLVAILRGGDILLELESYQRLDPGVLAYLGGDCLPVAEAIR